MSSLPPKFFWLVRLYAKLNRKFQLGRNILASSEADRGICFAVALCIAAPTLSCESEDKYREQIK